MSTEQLWELEEAKSRLLRQAYRMKQECPHMSPVGLESEMYATIMAEVRDITSRIQRSAEA
ncbi:MAG: aminotransferase class-III [Roseburia sp.]|nr:aminotransferase class-III [Roseburia sp.]